MTSWQVSLRLAAVEVLITWQVVERRQAKQFQETISRLVERLPWLIFRGVDSFDG